MSRYPISLFRRIVSVTLILGAIGAVVGALLGMLAAVALAVAVNGARVLENAGTILGYAAAFGGTCGFVVAPVAAWTLMRHVPIWRAVLETTVGTVAGAALGWVVSPSLGFVGLRSFALALVGFVVAALRLRFTPGSRASEPRLSLADARAVRIVSRAIGVSAVALLLTLASTTVTGTRLEVQDWDCPPAPASCARPVMVVGFPFPYVADRNGISVAGRASLVGAMLGEDYFRTGPFLANIAVYFAAFAVVVGVWSRVRRPTRER